jgi:FAD/FMN-containing dehydrogenase
MTSAISLPELAGQVIGPADPHYDEARRVYFHGYDRRPSAIVRAAGADDVARVIALARDEGLELAVRSGGHSSAAHGTTDDGVVLDLSGVNSLDIDAGARTAWAGPGLTAGEYTRAADEHGLVTGFGDTASVGIGGITLSGGLGFLVRKHGLTIDDLLAAEVVTADGQVLSVDDESHPDLFWALRGGGGNFGVVTRLKLGLHELGQVVGGMLMLPASPELIAAFVAAAQAAPEELSTVAGVMLAPPMPFIPAEHHGKPMLMIMLVFAGPPEAAEPAVAQLRALGEPVVDMVRPMRYPEMYELGEPPAPAFITSHNTFVDALDAGAAATILQRLPESSAPMKAVQIRVLGGAAARVPDEATAFAHRRRGLMLNIGTMHERADEIPANRDWVERLSDELAPGELSGYVGFYGDEPEERVRAAYPGSTWERLVEVKRRYDPANLFRLNQNIPPA